MSLGRWAVLALWLALLGAFWLFAQSREGSVLELLALALEGLSRQWWGPIALLGVFALRPLLLLPVTILNVFAGFLFGPVLGLLYALVATLLSSSIAYLGGWLLRGRVRPVALGGRAFETILTSRLLFVPGDLINYSAGAFRVSFVAFLAATALGGLPGLTVSVLTGASVEGQFRFSGVRVNGWYLVASAVLLVSSLALSYALRRRKLERGESD